MPSTAGQMPQQTYLECVAHLMFYQIAIKPVRSLLPGSALIFCKKLEVQEFLIYWGITNAMK